MSFNIEYTKSSICPFGGMTGDMLRIFNKLKTEKFVCVQTMDTKFGNSIFTLRGKVDETDFDVNGENVMELGRYSIPDEVEPIVSTAKCHTELAKAIDKRVLARILEFGEECEELPIDFKIGLNPCVRSAGLALTNKLLRLSRIALIGNRHTVSKSLAAIGPGLPTIACDIDHVLVFNAGSMSFDGGVFLVPISLDKSGGELTLTYHIVTDDPARNFVKLVESNEAETDWDECIEVNEASTIFSQIDLN